MFSGENSQLNSKPVQKKKQSITGSKSKAKTKTLKSPQKSTSKDKKKQKKSKRKARYSPPITMSYPSGFDVVKDTALSDGVNYRVILYGSKYKHKIHLLDIDLYTENIQLDILKGQGIYHGLEKLHNMVGIYNSTHPDTILGAINGNFWRAYTNHPIGPLIINGEVLELITYKQWTSGLFDKENNLFIDNFFMGCEILKGNRTQFEVDMVNRRKDSSGIVLYNKFTGSSVPYISVNDYLQDLNTMIEDAQIEQELLDSTDLEIDSTKMMKEIFHTKTISAIEFNFNKIALKYLEQPAVNKNIKCIVVNNDIGILSMPEKGCIISFGNNFDLTKIPRIGDTVTLKFTTNFYQDVEFYNGVCGTPRLVRNNIAKHEALEEGSRGRRFISMQLPRTAIGTNAGKDRLFLVCVEGTSRGARIAGASLQQLSLIMKKLGAHDAMNLDGGGSSIMLLNNKNVLVPGRPDASRRLSVGIGISKRKASQIGKKSIK
jgi:hypothetical protein